MSWGRLVVNFFWALSLLSVAIAARPAAATVVSASPTGAKRQRFTVAPFENDSGQKALDPLRAGLAALLAERLALHPGLRFAGPAAVFDRVPAAEAEARAAAAGARFVVTGRFDRRPDRKIHIGVEVHAPGAGASGVLGRGEAAGPRDDVARLALAAAVDALEAAGLPTPAERRAAIRAPFARDPYAFVLYARGVAASAGLDGRPAGSERALEGITRALVIDPRVPETRRFAGVLHLAAGRPGHARAAWAYAVDARPDYLAALVELAALDRTQGLPSARERYAALLQLDPDDLEARRAHGELCADAGRIDEARAELEKVVAAAPGDLRARRALALVLAAGRAGAELADELAEIVRLEPEDLDTRLELGAAYAGIGKIDAAVETYEEVLRRRPKNTVALKAAADLHRLRGDPSRAAAYYEKMRRLAPYDPRPLFLLGASYYAAGRLDAAERMFTEGARHPGMLADAYSNLGAIAYKRGRFKEAIWFLSRASVRRPQKAGVRFNYALALQAVDRHEDALREIQAATAAAPTDAEVRFVAGVVALRLGRQGEAEAAFREAVRLDPGHEAAKHNLGLLDSLKTGGERIY